MPLLENLTLTVKDAIAAARKQWRPKFVHLSYAMDSAGRFITSDQITGASFLVVHPVGNIVCLQETSKPLVEQLRERLYATV